MKFDFVFNDKLPERYMPEIDLNLSKQQVQFINSTSKGTIFRGGIGSGKTRILCYRAIINALRARRQLVVSFSYPMLRDVILHTFQKILPEMGFEQEEDYQINKGDMSVTLKGTQILLRSGDAPDSLRGINADDFFIDEARQFRTDEIFLILLGRIRESEDSQWFITSTPRGKDWVYDLSQSDNVLTIIQKTLENPFLPLGYINELKARYTTKFAEQELEAGIIEFGQGIIKPEWFNKVDTCPAASKVRFWDTAVSIKTASDYSSGALCSFYKDNFYLQHIVQDKFEYPELKKKIIQVAKFDGMDTVIALEQVGQTKGFVDDLKRDQELLNYTIRGVTPWADKLNRALPWITRAESGRFYMQRGPWNKKFEDECLEFTADDSHKHDDMIDSVSGAYFCLTRETEVIAARMVF